MTSAIRRSRALLRSWMPLRYVWGLSSCSSLTLLTLCVCRASACQNDSKILAWSSRKKESIVDEGTSESQRGLCQERAKRALCSYDTESLSRTPSKVRTFPLLSSAPLSPALPSPHVMSLPFYPPSLLQTRNEERTLGKKSHSDSVLLEKESCSQRG
jgi:hypothetical protein